MQVRISQVSVGSTFTHNGRMYCMTKQYNGYSRWCIIIAILTEGKWAPASGGSDIHQSTKVTPASR